MPRAEFDRQQQYLWSLVRQAGWDKAVKGQKHSRFAAYLLKTFQVTHANALTQKQMNQAIATVKNYVAKAKHEKKPRLRQGIMAYVSAKGQTIDWLHQNMEQWGYGSSMRELSYNQTLEVQRLVRKALP